MKTIPMQPIEPPANHYLDESVSIGSDITAQDVMSGVVKIRVKYPDAKLTEIELEAETNYEGLVEDFRLDFRRQIPNPNYDVEMATYAIDLAAYQTAMNELEEERKAKAKVEADLQEARKAHKEQSRNQRLAKREATAEEEVAVELFRAKYREEQAKKEKTQ